MNGLYGGKMLRKDFKAYKAVGLCVLFSLTATVSYAAPSVVERVESSSKQNHLQESGGSQDSKRFGLPSSSPQSSRFSPSFQSSHRPPSFSDFPPNQNIRVLIHLRDEPLVKQQKMNGAANGARASFAAATRLRAIEAAQQQLIGKLRTNRLTSGAVRRFKRVANAIATNVRAGDVDKILAMPDVHSVTVSRKMRAFLSESIDQIGVPEVWEMQDGNGDLVTGKGITIAILDTGIDYTHPDLGGCFGSGCKVAAGWDFVNNDSDPMDDHSHGTSVAGVAAANGAVKGVAPDATLHAYKVLDENGEGWDDQIIAGIERAVDPDGDPATDDAVDVINLSLGGWGGNTAAISQAANAAMQAGVVVVAAAGNDGPWLNSIGAPGSAKDIVTVGAVDDFGTLADFSSRGIFGTSLDMSTDAIKPEIVAPGVGINTTDLNESYGTYSGTSLASPHVAGAAALLLQLHPTLDSGEIKSLLVNRASSVTGDIAAVGAGLVDVAGAAQARFLVSPATLYMGHIGAHSTTEELVAGLTVKNLGSEVALDVSDSGGFPEGARLVPGDSQVLLGTSGEQLVAVNLDVDTEVLDYPEDLRTAFGSSLQLVSGSGAVNVPVGFHRSELMQLKESEAPLYYWSYGAQLFDETSTYSGYSDIYENEEAALYIAVRDKPLTGIFDIWTTDTMHGITNHLAADGPVVIPAGQEGFRIVKPELVDGAQTEYIEQIVEVTHADNPEFRVRRGYGGDLAPVRFFSLSPGFKLGYLGVIQKTEQSPFDRHLYVLKTQKDGPSEDITFDTEAFTSSRLLISNPEWNQSGYELVSWAMSYYKDLETYGWGSISPEITGSTLLTIHGDEAALITWPSFPAFSAREVGGGTVSDSWEISVGDGHYRKLRRSGSDVDRVATILERPQGDMVMGQGLRFWSSQLENQGGAYSLYPDKNGWSSTASVSDSWGNGYPNDIQYSATCVDSGASISGGTVRYSQLFTSYSGCSEVEVEFSYPVFLAGAEVEATSTLRMANVDQSYSPRIEMVELISDGELSVHGGADASIAVRVDETQPIAEVGIELALDGGAWEVLMAEYNAGKYVVPLPVVDGFSQASLKISVLTETGNSVVNTINSAFLLGADVANNVDLDDDGVVDAADSFPMNPTESSDLDDDGIGDDADKDRDNDGVENGEDAFPDDPSEWMDTDGDGVGNNEDSDDDGDGIPDSEDQLPLDPNESIDTDGDGIGNQADTDDDGDGVADSDDPFPLDPNEWLDTDGDGIGNQADTDDDGDGVSDSDDAFPLDPDEWLDTDGDGTGNQADMDDDGDGVSDPDDAFPLDSDEWLDTDGDGVGNQKDADDDGDGVSDAVDLFPLDQNETLDSDLDGVGNNADPDDDNDGVDDGEDQQPLDPNYWDVANANVQASAVSLEDVSADRGDSAIVVNAFQLNSNVSLILRSLTLQAAGSGNDREEIERVALYRDHDANGALDAGDELLSEADYQANDGRLVMKLDTPVALSIGKHSFVVTYDMAQ